MTELAATVLIEASRQAVWEVVTDMRRLDQWIPVEHELQEIPEQPLDEGDVFAHDIEVPGTAVGITWTATEVEAPSKAVWHGESVAGAHALARVRLDDAEGATLLRYECEYQPPGGLLGSVAAKAVEGRTSAGIEEALQRLKHLVESQRR